MLSLLFDQRSFTFWDVVAYLLPNTHAMSQWELVSVAAAGLEEYKHHQRLKRRGDFFTEDNLKIILFVINAITVLRGFYNG